jgi:hypothetical protein
MTIASEIQRIEGNISAAYTAADAKGATMPATENSDNLATCIASIPSGGGGSGKYQLLERVKDDSNNEIGTVSGFFTDANDVEYAVVCLDAQYRSSGGGWCSSTTAVTDLPTYLNIKSSNVWSAKDTATSNTQLILDYCTANEYSSGACEHCRTLSFTIDGVTYYGQLPNISEVVDICKHYNEFDALDTSASTSTSTNFNVAWQIWASSQNTSMYGWCVDTNGKFVGDYKSYSKFVCPILEIPNNA